MMSINYSCLESSVGCGFINGETVNINGGYYMD